MQQLIVTGSEQTRLVQHGDRRHRIPQKSNPAPQETIVTQSRTPYINEDTRQPTVSPNYSPGLAVKVAITLVNRALSYVNFLVSKSPVRLFEFCDLEM